MLELEILNNYEVTRVEFEHSLLSVSKWEGNYKKPFLHNAEPTAGEVLDYYANMIVTPDVAPEIVYGLTPEQMDQLAKYINEERTASIVNDHRLADSGGAPAIVTSELIYYWLTALRIPFHPTETWHLSRLMMLVRTTNFKQAPAEKHDPNKIKADWRTINAQRLAKYNTTG